jgi:predicted nucleic acid-binding protein
LSVFDASVVTNALVVEGSHGEAARSALAGVDVLEAPEILLAEVASALRSMVARREIDQSIGRFGLSLLVALRRDTYPIDPFVERVWELRDLVSVYDAWYVALAEHLETTLVTADERLTRVPGLGCDVRLPR